ncbi:MAG: 6-phospho-beta-glucosidase [Candidatus Lokiarchaeota archaeon]|nr:6-phospho-beta-glucosidase [Candidatus Lokiarchaeota archaeon]
MKLKIVIIGAGSSYTPELIEGFINKKKSLPIDEIIFVDIESGKEKLKIIEDLTRRMLEKENYSINLSSSYNLRESLQNTSYIINQIRVGGLNARSLDEKIPMKYNLIGQETTGVGGFAMALRSIPIILEIAKDIEDICPNAWLINFSNPTGIITETLNNHSNVRCLGLCNVPINMQMAIANKLKINSNKLYCEFIGLNHLSWIKNVFIDGINKIDEFLNQNIFEEGLMSNIPEVKGNKELIQSIRLIPSPYLDYYYFENEMLQKELISYQNNKTTRADEVKEIEKNLFEIYKDKELKEKPKQLSKRGGSLYSKVAISVIDNIHNNLGRIQVLNVQNNGAISDIANRSVIETNCIVNKTGAHPIAMGRCPKSILSLIRRVKTYEEYTIKAAISGNYEDAFLALLNHPLVHGANNAKMILDEILSAHKQYLPQFRRGG